MTLPDGKWYDEGNRGEMHDDLRQSYERTLSAIMKRPGTRKHFETCEVCQAIKEAKETEPAPVADMGHRELLRRRKVFMLDIPDLRKLLGLPENADILFMRVTGQNDILEVTACSPDYDVALYSTTPMYSRLQFEEVPA